MSLLRTFYNGGADPATADPKELRQRRAIALTCLLMLPLGTVVVLSAALRDNLQDALAITPALLLCIVAMVMLLRGVRIIVTAQFCIATLWSAPMLAMVDSGLSGVAWVWLAAIPVVSALLGGRLSGICWTLCSLAVIYGLGWVHAELDPFPVDRGTDWRIVVAELPLLLIALCVISQAFLAAQERNENTTRASVERLELEIEERTLAEQKARSALKAAQQAEARTTQFLATMSHELRTPLNGILGAADLLEDTRLNSGQSELVSTLRDSGHVLHDLVSDVLDLSRMEAGRMELETMPVELGQLLRQVTAPLRLQAATKGVALEVTLDPALPAWVESDPTRLRQILINLTGNAVKFTEEGSVQVSALLVRERLHLEVSDTGIGVAPDAVGHLFEPFQQADASVVRRYGGTGLGLSIVKRLTELLGGEVRCTSEPGVGTVFTVALPLHAAAPATDTSTTTTASTDQELHVLLVDDNPVNLRIGRKTLETIGHSVTEATDGERAIQAVTEQTPDLILMDVQMPVMDGLAATRALRQQGCTTPIIGLSANAANSDRAEALAAGMDAYLAKPIRRGDLRDTIARVFTDPDQAA